MNSRNSTSRLLMTTGLAIIALIAAVGPVQAQTVTGSILGTITDSSGARIPGASVTLTNLGTNDKRTVVSDNEGNYRFLNLLPGNYGITIEQSGFKSYSRQPIAVRVESAVRIDAAMELGSVTETVEVTTETPLLQTQTQTLGHIVEGRQVMDMPLNGRNVLNLVALVPGVVPQGATAGNPATANVNGWGNYQIGGGAANQSAAYIDGAPINVSYVNSTALVPTQEAIQEFRVATNNISPEFGRFAGGIINMSTKSGTNEFHGTAYEFLRNRSLNANTFFLNRTGTPRGAYTQNQFGLTLGGPIIKNKTFFFASYEGYILRQGQSALNTVPTAAMRAGDFSAISAKIYDPLTTCGKFGNPACAKDASGNDIIERQPFAGNKIPTNRLNQEAINLTQMLWPLPNLGGVTNNYQTAYTRPYNYNQETIRVDHRISDRQQLFAKYTKWHRNYSPGSPLQNLTGTGNLFDAQQAVLGDTYAFNTSTFLDVRLGFLRFTPTTYPLSCCDFKFSSIGPKWAQYQDQVPFDEYPQPNVVGMYNFDTAPIILDTDNAFTMTASLNKVVGRHNIKFGGEARRIEWYYAQTNTAGGTFAVNSGFTSRLPLASGSTPGSPSNTGYGFASWILGFPASGYAQEPALSAAVQHYYGLYFSDSFRWTRKLTLNYGIRWEQPGSFGEKNDMLAAIDLTLPQPELSKATGLNLQGGLSLVNSDRLPQSTWQKLHWRLFSPRVGFAYSMTESTVARGGYAISYLPNTVAFSLGAYNSPVNMSTTIMPATLDGGITPNLNATLSNPFPSGIIPPTTREKAPEFLKALTGQGIGSPLPDQAYPYVQQWNFDFQRQFGPTLMIEVGYAGSRGVHLPLYSVNLNQIPNQYIPMGNDLLTQVPNPFYGVIPASAGVMGQKTVAKGHLLKPYPQYLYISAFSPTVGDSWYRALQTKVQKKVGAAGTFMVAYTWSNFRGSADVLSPWLEANRFGVGGAQGVQDNNNIAAGESSISSFDVPHRLVISYVLDLPFGKGRKFLNGASGIVDKLISGWGINGITTLQSAFPLAFMNANRNALVENFAAGNAGPGTGAGVTRPNFIAGCNPVVEGTAQSRLGKWFNTSCYAAPGAFEFGNEPRVSPYLRAAGVNNFDFAVAKKTTVTERSNLEFRAEFFNLFNRVQFSPPNTQLGNATFGQVTAQYNQPRLIQFGLRLAF